MTRKTSSKPRNVVTLADLAPQRQVLGGGERRIFGADSRPPQENRMAASKTKDLPAGKNPKGGRIAYNDNLTLVRAAKPSPKDLPALKDVKAGKKVR